MSRATIAVLVGLAVSFTVAFGLSFALTAAGTEAGSTPWIMGAVIGTSVGAALSGMSGNRKMAKAGAEARKAALAMSPAPGRALIIVYREGFIARAVGVDLSLDGKDVAQLKSPRFTAVETAPGGHRMTAVLAGKVNATSTPADIAFDIAAGETAVFRLSLKMKLVTSDAVLTREPDPRAAQAKLAKMTMIAAAA